MLRMTSLGRLAGGAEGRKGEIEMIEMASIRLQRAHAHNSQRGYSIAFEKALALRSNVPGEES